MINQKREKKNKKYISSSEDEKIDKSPSNVSSEVPAPNSFLPNKLKILLKNRSMKTSAICQQKDTSVGKLFSCNCGNFFDSNKFPSNSNLY